tara:strand:+ start:1516 stop:2169 length:654 start_codon:yes stop_codon:yes gene_type:complete
MSSNTFIGGQTSDVQIKKYVSTANVAARIARNNKSLEFDKYDIAEWCAECEVDEIAMYENFKIHRGVQITVKKNIAELPCNVYRLLNVFRNKCSVPDYELDGNAILRFNKGSKNRVHEPEYKVEIDYMGIAVDEDGLPLILEGHQEACYWYCLNKLYFEDYLNNRIDNNRWMYIVDRLGHYVSKSKSSFRYVTRDDMNEVNFILSNMVRSIRMGRNV